MASDRTPAQRRQLANQKLDALFPDFSRHTKQQLFCDWPSERYSHCGHCALSPGQGTRVQPRPQDGWQDKPFFASESSSPGFDGSMEGV